MPLGSESRQKQILKTSTIGIVTNAILAVIKIFLGLISNSVAIILDAVNNVTDALSSIITIVMMRFANHPPTKKHPYGYGRMEYFGTALISFIILYAGLEAFGGSVDRILHPEAANYSIITIIIVIIGVGTKIVLGNYFKRVGKLVDSDSLTGSGNEAVFDAVISIATLCSIFITLIWDVVIDGYLGVFISIFIIKNGVTLLLDTLGTMLGKRIDGQLAKEIKREVATQPEVIGAYDLMLHNYGPMQMTGSVNVEVYENMTAREIFTLSRRIKKDIIKKYGISLVVGVYAINTRKDEIAKMEQQIRTLVSNEKNILGIHAFYVDAIEKEIDFDIVVDFEEKDSVGLRDRLMEQIHTDYPEWSIKIIIDKDFSD